MAAEHRFAEVDVGTVLGDMHDWGSTRFRMRLSEPWEVISHVTFPAPGGTKFLDGILAEDRYEIPHYTNKLLVVVDVRLWAGGCGLICAYSNDDRFFGVVVIRRKKGEES